MSTLEKLGAEIEENTYSNCLNVDRLIADALVAVHLLI